MGVSLEALEVLDFPVGVFGAEERRVGAMNVELGGVLKALASMLTLFWGAAEHFGLTASPAM
jgi:hypothetical protein